MKRAVTNYGTASITSYILGYTYLWLHDEFIRVRQTCRTSSGGSEHCFMVPVGGTYYLLRGLETLGRCSTILNKGETFVPS